MIDFEIKTTLMPHQNDAVAKLSPLKVGALFMDMGLGKSLTALKLAHEKRHKINKVIWLCPVGIKETIKRQILTHTTATAIDVIQTKKPKADQQFYIMGIESISSSVRAVSYLNALVDENTFLVVDESGYIKGHNSYRTTRITAIGARAKYRYILTGTPITQGVVDLFAQFRFLSPKILGYNSFYSFANNHLEYSDKYKGMIVNSHNTEHIAEKIKPYTYQATKEEHLELPEKLYAQHSYQLTYEQKELYEMAKAEILESFDEDEDDMAILRLFTALQQICSGHWNRRIKEKHKDDFHTLVEVKHNRVQALETVINTIAEHEKIIVWCKYDYDIAQIKPLLEKYGKVAEYHGGIKEKDRPGMLDFFAGEARFFLANPSTGGHGLTLNEASYTIFYNNSFKYADRLQAEDRNHRIGQTKSVVYIDVVAENSIDERIMKSIESKGNVVESFRKEMKKTANKKEVLMQL